MEFIGDLESHLVRRWFDGDERAGLELAEGFWDRQYLRRYGPPKIPGVQWPVGPLPDPSPEFMQHMQSELMANVVGWILADPDPQPNQIPPKLLGRNLLGLLANKELRLKSARAVHERITVGLGGLEAEIERLSP